MPEEADLLYYTAWLLTHDKNFLQTHHNVSWRVIPRGALQYLVALAFRLNGQLSPAVVSAASENDAAQLRRHGTDRELAQQTFQDLETAYDIIPPSLIMMREICGEWLGRRAMKVGTEEALVQIQAGDLDRARALLGAAQYDVIEKESPITLEASGQQVLDKKWRRKEAMPTGLDDWDRALFGGIRGGDLLLVVGATGVGKSMFVDMLSARAFWNGRYALYYTTELSREQILKRIITGILARGEYNIPDKPLAELIALAAEEQGEELGPHAGIEVRDGNIPIAALEKEFEEFKELHGFYPGMLAIDDPADMIPPGKHEKDYQGIRATFVHLRTIAKKYNVPVCVVGQAKQSAIELAYISLKHIGDAFAKAQKSHYVIGLSQTDMQKISRDGPRMNVYILKDSLHGTTGGRIMVEPMWGHGGNGYPGLHTIRSNNLTFDIMEPPSD